MAERRENSVLFSLNELRGIEQDRIRGEEEAERARIEAEKRAREEEIRRAKEAEEAKRRAEEERVLRAQQEKERLAREHDLRLKESERRAQIEAATKLEQTRIEAEARARMEAKKFPTGKVVGGMLALVCASGGALAYIVSTHNQQQQRILAEKAEIERKAEENRKLLAEEQGRQAQLEKQINDLKSQLEKAGSDTEREKIRQRIAETVRAKGLRPGHAAGTPKPAKSGPAEKSKPSIADTNDPLGGLL